MRPAGWSPRGVNIDLLPPLGQEVGLWTKIGDTVKGATLGWKW